MTVGSNGEGDSASGTWVPSDRKTSAAKIPTSVDFQSQPDCYSLIVNLLPSPDYTDMLPSSCSSLHKPNPNPGVLTPASLLEVLTYSAQLSIVAYGTKSGRACRQSGCSP